MSCVDFHKFLIFIPFIPTWVVPGKSYRLSGRYGWVCSGPEVHGVIGCWWKQVGSSHHQNIIRGGGQTRRLAETNTHSSVSILKAITPEYSLEGLMLKLQILWLPDGKIQLIRKDPDAGKDWRQEEKGTTEDEMVGWLHQRDGHEFEQAPAVGDGQGGLVCCSPWGHKEWDKTEWLNWTEYQNV